MNLSIDYRNGLLKTIHVHYHDNTHVMPLPDGDFVVIFKDAEGVGVKIYIDAADAHQLRGQLMEVLSASNSPMPEEERLENLFGEVLDKFNARPTLAEVEEPTRAASAPLSRRAQAVQNMIDPPLDPPTSAEIESQQSQLFDEFAGELALATTASRVAELDTGIEEAHDASQLTDSSYVVLSKEAAACKRRLSK